MKIISDWKELRSVCSSGGRIYLWGCGMKTMLLFEAINLEDLNISCEAVLVTDKKANISELYGCKVKEFYTECIPDDNDIILISTMSVYWDDILGEIRNRGCNSNIYALDEKLEGIGHLNCLKKTLTPFFESFNHKKGNRCNKSTKTIWSCWWQGEDQAPKLVKACWRSWRINIPDSYEIKIITRDNYWDYVDIPYDIMNRVVEGVTKLQPVTDIIRMQLLYRYGGIWMDSTTYLTAELPASEIENYDIYTYHLPSHDYGSDTSWTVWFMGGRPGELLFRFVYESLIWYLMRNDNVLFYLQIDYTIALATKLFPKILGQFDKVPIRNGNPSDLRRRLESTFDKQEYKEICNRCQIHKLSWYGYKYQVGSFMDYIINS